MSAGLPGAAVARPVSWDSLDGWDGFSATTALSTFLRSASAVAERQAALRAAARASPDFDRLCRQSAGVATSTSASDARRFFEIHFTPHRVDPSADSRGFLTGYYEPLVEGALTQSPVYAAPILDWPGPAEAGSRDRAAWEDFAISSAARPVAWLRDWTEVFLVQVQGSARVVLPDGRSMRLVYAGRNGAPYTSIGRRLVDTGRIAAADMSLATLKAWLRAHGQDRGGEARALMQENRSYIFFRREDDPDETRGPIGGQGLPLDPGCSIAVDRNLWCYGLPFWIESETPLPGFGPEPLRRLFVAQDTGSAILGPARADLFLGSGEAAGEDAGRIRHEATFTVLLPRVLS